MNLSIIIPVYNTASYLQKCYQSVIDLYNVDFEIIFVNDGSTDNSLEVIEAYSKENSNVKIINQTNQGLSAARNAGIEQVSGDYFILLDSDDWIEKDALVQVLNKASVHDADIIGFYGQYVDEHNQINGKTFTHPLIYNQLMSGEDVLINGFQPSSACLFLYKTAFVKSNHLTFTKGIMQEDVEFTARMFIKAHKVMFVDNIVYNYYRRSDSMTTTKNVNRIKQYLSDSIEVARLINLNVNSLNTKALNKAIVKNSNAVVWNLLWRFYKSKGEVDFDFKVNSILKLKEYHLYPIKGPQKTTFQKFSSILMNIWPLFKKLINN